MNADERAPERVTARDRLAAIARAIVPPLVSVAGAIVVGSIVIRISGYDPVPAFSALFHGAFGGIPQLGETLLRATPLLFSGLAVGYGFRAGLFNIGAEGQLFMGGLAAAWLGVVLAGLPWWVNIPVILVLGALAGAAWAFVPAILKAKVGAHEVITTMMFGYIARYLVSWLVGGPLKAPGPIPQTAEIAPSARLPLISDVFTFVTPNRAHVGFLIAVGLAFVVWLVFKYTTLGYEARAVGFNPAAAETGGISVAATTVKSLCISGAFAGLAGVVEVMGVQNRIFDQFSSGFGFTGIAVALLARNNPLGIVLSALLFGALSAGGPTMQLEANVPQKIILIIQGLVILFVAAEGAVALLLRRRKGVRTDAV